MDTETVAELIESGIPDASAEVTTPRDPDEDDYYAATVVSPAFERESLVNQYEREV
jgi:stress-induced morphogen